MTENNNFDRTIVITLLSVLILVGTLLILDNDVKNNTNEYDLKVRTLFENVLVGVKNMRELQVQDDTDLIIVSIQWFIDQEKEKVLEESEEINLQDIIYESLFLVPEDYDIGESRVNQAGRILSAVSGNRLYIVKEYFNPEDINSSTRTLAHEITHLLQSKFKSPNLLSFDQRQAWISVIEGDADFTADTYMSFNVESFLNLYQVSDSLDKIKGFPYKYGSGFVSKVFDVGGWNSVNSIYQDPPISTEEILHPEIYFMNESIIEINSLLPKLENWDKILTDTYGEFFIRIMLEKWIEIEDSIEAAKGWGGDNLSLFSNGQDYLLTWRILWDFEQDSSEFYDAYKETIFQTGGEEVENGLYKSKEYYLLIEKDEHFVNIAISKNMEAVISIKD